MVRSQYICPFCMVSASSRHNVWNSVCIYIYIYLRVNFRGSSTITLGPMDFGEKVGGVRMHPTIN